LLLMVVLLAVPGNPPITSGNDAGGKAATVVNLTERGLDGFDLGYYARSPRVDPVSAPSDPYNPVRRGGSFNDATALARSAVRDYDASEIAAAGLGFRPARAATP